MSEHTNPDWDEIERVIGAVLDMPEEQRAAYIAQHSVAVQNEVDSLLSAYRRSSGFLGEEPGKPVAPAELLERMKAMLGHLSAAGETGTAEQAIVVTTGTKLGYYTIEGVIGQGGMGVVYRALDTRLNRPVAVKFLFEDLADPAARRRFQREAQLASSLNHPHILTVYDVGDFDGRQYLVTEFVDGGTLKDWARTEKRGWREIVGLLLGVADGLAAAHGKGILHRDIKPDNILVGRNGYAKLSDFGLAKLQEQVPPRAITQTLSKYTGPGIVIGTISYMSPEQASGQMLDQRSDIFSFGIVLFELLAGKRPFERTTDLEVMQAILHSDAPPLAADVPVALQMLVAKALEKAPPDRYQSMRELVVDLRRLTRQSGQSTGPETAAPTTPSTPAAKRAWIPSVPAAIAVLVILLAAATFLWWFKQSADRTPRQVMQFDIFPPAGTIFEPPIGRQPFALSPDGKRLAMIATSERGTNIWLRDLASPEMHTLPGTDGAWSIFWAPDNRSIYFGVKNALKQVSLETGAGRAVAANLPSIPRIGTWRSNGDLVLYSIGGGLGGGQLYELHTENGSLQKGPFISGMRWPQFLPGGKQIVFTLSDKASHTFATVADYADPKPVSLMQTDSRVEYTPPLRRGDPGYLLFIRGESLLAQPFDSNHLKLDGEAFPIAQNVVYYGSNLAAAFSASANGVLAYQSNFPLSELKWYDRSGNPVGVAGRPATLWGQVRASRDGQRVGATVWSPENGGTGIWIFDANGRESRRLTFPPDIDRRPVWSPDGTRIATGKSSGGGAIKFEVLDVSGSGAPEEFTLKSQSDHVSAYLPTDWSWDGRFIAFDDGVGAEQHNVWLADVSSHTLAPFLKNNFAQWGAAFSRDGKWISFVSLESGRPEVYVQGFESQPEPHMSGERRQVSRDGAWLVRWRADGRELFYCGIDNVLHAVPVTGALAFGEPKALFKIPGIPQYGTTRDFQFDVSPDGQRFIIPTTGSVPPPPFTIIENWQEKFHR